MFREKIYSFEPENPEFVSKQNLDGKEWRQCVRTLYDKLYVFTENDRTIEVQMKTKKVSLMKKAGKPRFYFAT
jgi:hypothetical protein